MGLHGRFLYVAQVRNHNALLMLQLLLARWLLIEDIWFVLLIVSDAFWLFLLEGGQSFLL